MTKLARLVAAAALLTCSGAAMAQPGPYYAVGTEPFWSVTIENGRMVYEDAEGKRVDVATPRPAAPRYMGRIYHTPQLIVSIRRSPCSDGMSDRIYEDRVLVTVDRRELSGCGSSFAEPSRLTNTNWRIIAINGRAVGTSGPYHMEFTADRLSGQTGCNRFGSGYRLNGDRLAVGPVTSTRMACPAPHMANERFALRMLSGPVRVSQPSEQVMMLTGNGGSIRLQMVPVVPGARPRR